ncbi:MULTISPECIES: hypothetical protein [Helicobacter]|uniref:Uncharacterized protein n=2 Tax=Helicobacter typhlonius TaxID=76936 RepID=A0A4U8RXL8_9HELI|nr:MULTISPECIES: hypothetical protein [Helicobacter]TLD77987.1 hypothetical protein LS75_008420 [Helicobacter typhlonius]TLD87957.1 hypothetical protein LS67_005845 [Helicobacter sp. MIT 03-1616]
MKSYKPSTPAEPSSNDTKNSESERKFFFALFIFIFYIGACILFVLLYRRFIAQVPIDHHSFVELVGRAIVLSKYLIAVNLPVLFLFNPKMQRSHIVFGVCLAIIIVFVLTGLHITLTLSVQIVMIPWFVIWQSFAIVGSTLKDFFKHTPHLKATLVFFTILKIIIGFCLGALFFVLCIILQIYNFDGYDFSGLNYGIPYHKQTMFQSFGF